MLENKAYQQNQLGVECLFAKHNKKKAKTLSVLILLVQRKNCGVKKIILIAH